MLLRSYIVVSSLLLVVLTTAAFRQAAAPGNLGEITVERINVVDRDGTLRLVLSNKDRMHPGVMDGKTIERERRVAGLLFFNDQGDEVGGLTFTGQATNGTRSANAGLMFDQLKQDQTIGISYDERDGRRTTGLRVWDPPDARLTDLIVQLNEANRMTDRRARETRIAAIRAAAPKRPERVFVGKTDDKAATITLKDGEGRPRLTLAVEKDGAARIEFLDENGKVTSRFPEAAPAGRGPRIER